MIHYFVINMQANYSDFINKYLMKIFIAILTVVCIALIKYIGMFEQKRNIYHIDLIQSAVTQHHDTESMMPQQPVESKIILFWTPNYLPAQSSSFSCFPYQCQFTKDRTQFNKSNGVIFAHFGSKYCIYIFIYKLHVFYIQREVKYITIIFFIF